MAIRTPLVRLHVDAPAEIWLKLENLQPIGSFKLRGAANAILSAPREAIAEGVVTTSTGNMAQGVAWMARELGVPATIVVPDNASMGKLAAVERLGGRIVRVPWERWWAAVEAGSAREAAEGAVGAEHIKAELGEVLAGMHPGREHEDELTVFESLGIAVEDLASAELVVRRARERGVGVEVDF